MDDQTVPLEDHKKLQEQYNTLKNKSTEIANQRDFYKGILTSLLGELTSLLVGVSPLVEKTKQQIEDYKPWAKNDTEPKS